MPAVNLKVFEWVLDKWRAYHTTRDVLLTSITIRPLDIMRELDLAPSTVYRALSYLQMVGFLYRQEDQAYGVRRYSILFDETNREEE